MIGEMLNIIFGINDADNKMAAQRLAAEQAKQKAEWERRIFDLRAGIIDGEFTVVEEPALLEHKAPHITTSS